jgi:hypothetical protein
VSAKLESGAPFASSNFTSIAFDSQLLAQLAKRALFTWWSVNLQSFVAVPFDQPDTLQAAFAVTYEIAESKTAEASGEIGLALTRAMQGLASVSGDASLFEVAYTITPCHIQP